MPLGSPRPKGKNMFIVKKRNSYLEASFQSNVVRFLRSQGFYVFAVPNASSGKLNLKQGAMLKREGLLAGVSDLIIVLQNRVVFVELKNPNGKGYQSDTQKAFESEVTARGHEYLLWQGWPEIEAFVNAERANKGWNEIKVGGTD